MNQFSKQIWNQNYRMQNQETVQDTFIRVAKAVSSVQDTEEKRQFYNQKFYQIMNNGYFVPGGRILSNAGVEGRSNTTLMNCYVHTPEQLQGSKDFDSLNMIYELLKKQALTLASQGGYGSNFSYIRPYGSFVRGMGGRTPGVLAFLQLYNISANIITKGATPKTNLKNNQKKKIRKGAQLACLEVWHPDIISFIQAKRHSNSFTFFNLSVGITKGFMEAVINNTEWNLIFPDIQFDKYDTQWNGNIEEWKNKNYPIIVYETIKAKQLWDKIMFNTYNYNDPGVLFLDVANQKNPLYYAQNVKTSNPCGEILMSTGVCNLGSLVLPKFIKQKGQFDYKEFQNTIKYAIRFLDNINDLSNVPLDEYKDSMVEKRRIGLGTMGLGSCLMMLSTKYGSKQSLQFIENLYKYKTFNENYYSALLGKQKGNFKLFDKDKYFNSKWWKQLKLSDIEKETIQSIGCMRNSHKSANAPNGQTGIFAGIVSGGIQPVFSRQYTRWVTVVHTEVQRLRNKGFLIPNFQKGQFEQTLHFKKEKRGRDQILKGEFENELYQIDKGRGLIKANVVRDYGWQYILDNYDQNIIKDNLQKGLYSSVSDYEYINNQITIKQHLDVLKIISHYTDLNSSKTVNVSKDCSYDQFKDIYLDAWMNKIKGITTYREGTMTAVLQAKGKTKQYQNELQKTFQNANGNIIIDDVKIPKQYFARGFKMKDKNGKKWYFTLAFVDGTYTKPFAIFTRTNNRQTTEVTNLLIEHIQDLLINKKIKMQLIEKQRQKYKNNESNVDKMSRAISMCLRHNINISDIVQILDRHNNQLSSFLFHIKKLLSRYIPDGTISNKKCDECKSQLVYQQGCFVCMNCGFSKCG